MIAPDAVFAEGKYKSGLWDLVGEDRVNHAASAKRNYTILPQPQPAEGLRQRPSRRQRGALLCIAAKSHHRGDDSRRRRPPRRNAPLSKHCFLNSSHSQSASPLVSAPRPAALRVDLATRTASPGSPLSKNYSPSPVLSLTPATRPSYAGWPIIIVAFSHPRRDNTHRNIGP